MTIEITAEVLESPDLPPNFPALFEAGVERIWNGTFPNHHDAGAPPWEVETHVTITPVPRWQQRGEHRIYLWQLNEKDRVMAEVNRLGGRVMRIDPDLFTTLTTFEREREVVYAHEVGHWLKLGHFEPGDEPRDSDAIVNLMRGDAWKNGQLNEEGVDNICDLLQCRVVPKEDLPPSERSHWIRRPDYKG